MVQREKKGRKNLLPAVKGVIFSFAAFAFLNIQITLHFGIVLFIIILTFSIDLLVFLLV